MTAVDEIDRPDGIVPVTPQAVGELVAEIRRLRAKIERGQDQSIAQYAEIKRLRVENKRLRGWIAPDILELTDTIERLRAALQSLTVDPPATLDEPDTDAEVIIKMRAIARRALEPKP